MPKSFPHYRQMDAMDCGPTCLRMVAKYYGRSYSTAQLRELAEIGKDGVNLLGIAQAAERVGAAAGDDVAVPARRGQLGLHLLHGGLHRG
ncbi:MAG: hypothetical protein EAZ26_11570, partial [Runella slithyformis]